MMLYDFECQGCQRTFESLTKPWDPVICPYCGCTDCKRMVSAGRTIGTSVESKESKRREGKRERMAGHFQRQGIKL